VAADVRPAPPPAGAGLLEVEGLRGGYEETEILQGITFGVAAGTLTAVIGPNGAGKSTLLRAIFGRLRISAGAVRLKGLPITGLPPRELRRRGIAYVAQGRCSFPRMTVRENLEVAAFVRRDTRGETTVDGCLERFPLLARHRSRPAGDLSGGQQQLLELAMGLLAEPALLLVDEPSMGLAPTAQIDVWAALRAIRQGGTTILLVEQNARRALELADRGLVLELGQVRHEGPAAPMLDDPGIRRLYLGG
jgi:ABC-type branched-subunit amino acid transport system ATPase component